MKIGDVKRYEDTWVLLEEGTDYQKEQLMTDALFPPQKRLGQVVLTDIARRNGYDGCVWSGNECEGKILVKFRQKIYI